MNKDQRKSVAAKILFVLAMCLSPIFFYGQKKRISRKRKDSIEVVKKSISKESERCYILIKGGDAVKKMILKSKDDDGNVKILKEGKRFYFYPDADRPFEKQDFELEIYFKGGGMRKLDILKEIKHWKPDFEENKKGEEEQSLMIPLAAARKRRPRELDAA